MRILAMAALTLATPSMAASDAGEVVSAFLAEVRSGQAPDHASTYMASKVLAHQMNAEGETTVERTPEEYAAHVREFLKAYGPFKLTITEQIAAGDKVYVRWQQDGKHLESISGEAPTGEPLREIASAVYRVANGKIVEYWIQIDRLGLDRQLLAITSAARAAGAKK